MIARDDTNNKCRVDQAQRIHHSPPMVDPALHALIHDGTHTNPSFPRMRENEAEGQRFEERPSKVFRKRHWVPAFAGTRGWPRATN